MSTESNTPKRPRSYWDTLGVVRLHWIWGEPTIHRLATDEDDNRIWDDNLQPREYLQCGRTTLNRPIILRRDLAERLGPLCKQCWRGRE